MVNAPRRGLASRCLFRETNAELNEIVHLFLLHAYGSPDFNFLD